MKFLMKHPECVAVSTMTLQHVQMRSRNLLTGLKVMSYKEQLRTLGLSSLEKGRLRHDLMVLYNFLRRRHREGCAELFSPVFSDRTHRNG